MATFKDLLDKCASQCAYEWSLKDNKIYISTDKEKEKEMSTRLDDLQKFRVMEAILKDFCMNYGIGFDMEFREFKHSEHNYFVGNFEYDGKHAKRWEIKLSTLDDVEDAERKAKEIIRILRNIFAIGGTFSSTYKNYSKASTNKRRIPKIERVIFNDPATIVFWKDGTKTVVRAFGGDEFDPEKGLAMAFSKKALGNDYEYYNEFLRQLKKADKED